MLATTTVSEVSGASGLSVCQLMLVEFLLAGLKDKYEGLLHHRNILRDTTDFLSFV